MTLRQKAKYIDRGLYVALPLEEHCETWEACEKWKNLSKKQFMKDYGDDVLKLYRIPTEKELKQLEKWDEDGDDSDYDSDDESD